MFRGGAFCLLVGLSSIVLGQGYTENWRTLTSPIETGERIVWTHLRTTPTNEVVAYGLSQVGLPPQMHGPAEDTISTVILAKFNEDGDPLWVTRDFSGPGNDINAFDLQVDGAGNAYVAFQTGPASANVNSFASATGAFRWSSSVAIDTLSFKPVSLAVRTAGNSTFVYAGVNVLQNNLKSVRLVRFNSANGGILQSQTVTGASGASIVDIRTDLNGNVFTGGSLGNDGDVRKFNQSLSPVWAASFVGGGPSLIAFDGASNRLLATARSADGQGGISSLNGTNGSIQNTLNLGEGGNEVRDLHPGPFGSWLMTQGGGAQLVVGVTSSLLPLTRKGSSKIGSATAADSSGQVHFGTTPNLLGRLSLLRLPGDGLFETIVGNGVNFTATTVDSSDRVLVAGTTSDGEAVVIQLNQNFLTNTDVIVRDFTGPLNIEAPGVLANDTNWVGGTLSVVTQPTEGTVTLNQDGSFLYTPGANYDGTDQFQYRVTKNGVPRTATCVVKQLVFTQLTLNQPTVVGEFDISGRIAINNANVPFEISPTLTISSPVASLASPIKFKAPNLDGGFTLRTKPVNVNTPVTISVSSSGQTRSATFTVLPGGFKDIITVNNAPLISGEASAATLRLTGPTAADRVFSLAKEGPISVPTSVTVLAGQSSVNFLITTSPNTVGQAAKIRLFTASGLKEFPFTIQAKAQLQSLEPIQTIVYAGTSFSLRANLDGQNGTSAASITLSDSSAAVISPATIVVPAGGTSGIGSITANLAAANTIVTFTGVLNGVTKTIPILVRNNLLESFVIAPNVINRFQIAKGTISLNWVATGRGQIVEIASDSNLVSLPSSITIPTGQTTFQFDIKPKGVGTVTISVRIGQKKLSRTLTITN